MNHIEVLVEDLSGKAALDIILPKILSPQTTVKVHAYRGIGRIPPGLRPNSDAAKRILLDQLPRLIAGYGKAFRADPPSYRRHVIVICDLDDRNAKAFTSEIFAIFETCDPKPSAFLRLAIEEGEAWLLGDGEAVVAAYPKLNRSELARYEPDAICGTWEFLADLVEKGGSQSLKARGFVEVGRAKHRWAEAISMHVNIDRNRSPSFQALKHTVEELCAPA